MPKPISNERGYLWHAPLGCMVILVILMLIVPLGLTWFKGGSLVEQFGGLIEAALFFGSIFFVAVIMLSFGKLLQFIKQNLLTHKRREKYKLERFFTAVKKDNINKVNSILKKNPEIVNAKDSLGATPLHYAVKYIKVQMVEFLISRGADVNVKDKEGSTPLQDSKAYGQSKITGILRRHSGN